MDPRWKSGEFPGLLVSTTGYADFRQLIVSQVPRPNSPTGSILKANVPFLNLFLNPADKIWKLKIRPSHSWAPQSSPSLLNQTTYTTDDRPYVISGPLVVQKRRSASPRLSLKTSTSKNRPPPPPKKKPPTLASPTGIEPFDVPVVSLGTYKGPLLIQPATEGSRKSPRRRELLKTFHVDVPVVLAGWIHSKDGPYAGASRRVPLTSSARFDRDGRPILVELDFSFPTHLGLHYHAEGEHRMHTRRALTTLKVYRPRLTSVDVMGTCTYRCSLSL